MATRSARSPVALLLGPTLVGGILFFIVPAVAILAISFAQWDLLSPARWVGLANYAAVLTDGRTGRSLVVTAAIGSAGVGAEIALGLIVGKALAATRRTAVVGTIILIPWMAAPLTVGIIWRWMLAPSDGAVAGLLGQRVDLLVDPIGASVAVIVATTWQSSGFVALLFAAALRAVPGDLRAAAAIDGAGRWTTLRHIEWPLLRPITFFLLAAATIRAFAIYDIVAPLTGGGPNGATTTVSALIVEQAWLAFEIGPATALACVITTVECVLLAVLWSAYRRGPSS
jgi:multiple sugar transport system permease protein